MVEPFACILFFVASKSLEVQSKMFRIWAELMSQPRDPVFLKEETWICSGEGEPEPSLSYFYFVYIVELGF